MFKKSLALSLLVMLVLALSAPVAAQDEFVFPIGEGPFHWESLDAFREIDLSGQTIDVFGPWLGPDQELWQSVYAYFEDATGATINYAGSDSFEQQIVIDVAAGSPPNIAIFPQPGLAANLAAQGNLVPLGEELETFIAENYAAGQSWVDLSSYPDENGDVQFFAFPFKADLKSLVWFVPENFEDAGYAVPTTMEELIARSRPKCTTAGSATKFRSTTSASSMLSKSLACSPRTKPGSMVASLPSLRPTSVTPRRACSRSRRTASCTTRRASFRPSSPKAPSWA